MPNTHKDKRESIMLLGSLHRRLEVLASNKKQRGEKTNKQTLVEMFVLKGLEAEEAKYNEIYAPFG